MGVLADEYIRLRADTSHMPREVRKAGGDAGRTFGGAFSGAAKKLIVAGAIYQGLKTAARFLKEANAEAVESIKVGQQTAQTIKTTGGAANISAKQISALSTAISNKTGIDDEAVQSGANLLLTFTKVRNETGKGNDIFNQATQTVQDMSVVFKQSGKQSAIQLGKALQDPIKGVGALARVGVQFTDQQKEQIKTLVESGDILGAQKIILGELKTQTGGAAAATTTGTEKMRVGWNNVKEAIGLGFRPVLDEAAGAIATNLFPILIKGATWLGQKIPVAVDAAKNAFARFGAFIQPLVLGVKAMFAAFREGDVTSDGLVGTFERVGVALRGAFAFIQANVIPALKALGQFVLTTVIPAWVQWQQFMASQLMPIIKQLGAFFVANIIPAFKAVVGFIVTQMVPGFLSIVTTVKGLVSVVAPIVGQLVAAVLGKFNQMKPQIMSIWNSIKEIITGVMFIIKEVIQAVTVIIGGIWNRWGDQIKKVVTTIFGALVGIISGVMKAIAGVIKLFVALIKGDWQGAWNAIKQIFSGVWQAIKSILSLATAFIVAAFQAWWNKIKSLWTSATTAVKTTWSSFWTNVKTTAATAIDAVRTKVSTVLDKIKAAFQTAKDNIKRIWEGLKDVVSKPVEWIRQHVYNTPLVDVWNKVAKLVNGPTLSNFATGGVLPGYSPGRDTIPIMASGGEAIMRPEWTRAVGKDWVDKANKAARSGKRSLHDFLGESVPGSQGGGIGWMSGLASTATATASGLYQKLKGWYLGGLRVIAGKALNPTKGLIDKAMPNSGVGTTVGNIGKKAIDLILDKIKSVDVVPDLGGGPAGSAIASGGWASIYRILRAVGARSFTTYPGHDQGASRSRDIWPASAGNRIAETARRISSIWYVIWNRRIASITTGRRWIGYHGSNPHTSHVHVTLRPGVKAAMGGVVGNGLASGGIVKGGRGGINALIGEGKRDELVTPLPRGWNRAPGLSDDKLDRLIAVLEARGNEGLSLDLQVDVNTNEPRSVRLNRNLQRVGGGVGLVG